MELKNLSSVRQLKELSPAELRALAGDIRAVLLETVSRTGGHLAPNLGVVELTLALHTVFESPLDKILWDVSHQSYPHKLLTGRYGRFHSLRQYQGITGFTNPEESEHDHFHWGHASTSISAAVGMAKARDTKGEQYEVVAVIGDGALTGGMAYEGLNHAGGDKTKVIVVLNDNSMSIAPNVGGISRYLSRIRTGWGYQTIKRRTADVLPQVPWLGQWLLTAIDRWKESVKHLFLPTMFFEDLGWTYLGPVDGHDIGALQEVLTRAKRAKEPVVVHVVTTKGKGVQFAEEMPGQFHGVGSFDAASGTIPAGSTTYSDVFGNAMVQLAQADPRVVGISASMPGGTALSKLATAMPNHFFDVGIAEQHATTFAAGMAKQGMRPVFAVYSTFLQRAFDQVVHDVCVQKLPVVFAIDRSGLVEDGATHQGVYDVAYLRCLPNIVIGAPKDENELQHMLYTGIHHEAGPFAFRYPRGAAQGVPLDARLKALPIGRGEVLRPGRDVAILALGVWAPIACRAAELLAQEGIDVCVINPRWVKPLDVELITSAARNTGALVTVEEATLMGGFGAAVLEVLSDRGLSGVYVKRIGIPDILVAHGKPKFFHDAFCISVEGIAAAARVICARKTMDQRHTGVTV